MTNNFYKKDALTDAVKSVMEVNQFHREAEALVNEMFGVVSRKALPHEQQAAWDAEFDSIISEGAMKRMGDDDGGMETYRKKPANLSPKQMKIAKMAGDPKKIDAEDLAALRAGKKTEQIDEGQSSRKATLDAIRARELRKLKKIQSRGAHLLSPTEKRIDGEINDKINFYKRSRRLLGPDAPVADRAIDRLDRQRPVNEEQINEVGDTRKGQKLLAKVLERATNRLVKATNPMFSKSGSMTDKDKKTARKYQDVADMAYDRIVGEEQIDEMDLSGVAPSKNIEDKRTKGSRLDRPVSNQVTKSNQMKTPAMSKSDRLDEKMNMKKAKMGDVITDFEKSDAPQFKGKSKEKRRQMAIAAKLSAERMDEAKSDVYHQHMLKALGKKKLPKDHSYTSSVANNGDFVVRDGGGRTVGRIPKGEHNLMKESIESIDEATIKQGSKEHLASLKGMLNKAKPGSTEHWQTLDAISSIFGDEHIPAKHKNVKPRWMDESIESIHEEIAMNLYAELNYVMENYGDNAGDEWIANLSEEQLEIMEGFMDYLKSRFGTQSMRDDVKQKYGGERPSLGGSIGTSSMRKRESDRLSMGAREAGTYGKKYEKPAPKPRPGANSGSPDSPRPDVAPGGQTPSRVPGSAVRQKPPKPTTPAPAPKPVQKARPTAPTPKPTVKANFKGGFGQRATSGLTGKPERNRADR